MLVSPGVYWFLGWLHVMCVLWVVLGVWRFIKGVSYHWAGAQSPAGRRGESKASPNTPAGRRGGGLLRRVPGQPQAGTIRDAQAKSSGAAAAHLVYDVCYWHIMFRYRVN